jgi:hypothetical protein
MTISRATHPKALWPGVKAWWGRAYDEHEEQFPDLFDIETSDKAYEEDVEITGFGLAPVKREGVSHVYDEESQGATSRYTHVAYGMGYIVTYEEYKDNLYEKVSRTRATALAFSFRQTKENVCAIVYNRAFNTNFTGGDGKALAVSDHPAIGGTYSNVLATPADLAEASLEDLLIQVDGAADARGMKIGIKAKSLHIPRQERFNATRILKSTLQNDTANHAINALRVQNALPGGVHVNTYFSSDSAFFVRTNVPNGMKMYVREAIMFDKDNDFHTKNALAAAYERYAVGWTDPRAVFASAGV